jgi:iron complex transport system substrate-binding protein
LIDISEESSAMALSRLRSAALLVIAALTLAGCGSGSASGSGDATNAAAAGFPVTIDHLFGSTTIKAKPQRVVTIGGA